jgi:hypothetical protein
VRGLTYAEKRLALEALNVRVRLYRTDHEPRYEITASIPLGEGVKRTLPTTQQCSVSGTPRGHRQKFDQESGGDTPCG